MRILFALIFLSFSFAFGAPLPKTSSTPLFGVELAWSGNDDKVLASLGKEIDAQKKRFSGTLDPDCYYKKTGNKGCGQDVDKELLKSAENLAAELKRETNNAFDVRVLKPGKTYRDFGGMAQGLFLEHLRSKIPDGWTGNFAGDIFVSKSGRLPAALVIPDPATMPMPFAIVSMEAGWMIGGTAPNLGGKIRNPRTGDGLQDSEFNSIVLLAQPEFNGARLDAWETALLVGGKKLLKELWENKKYEGQWAFVYFDQDNKPICSENLNCQFKDARRRLVKVPW